jgi:hypothetical protein
VPACFRIFPVNILRRSMRRTAICIAFLLASVPLFAQRTGVAKYAGEFMSWGVGGRALAMGGASVALANDVTAAYWNPAGLMQLQYPEIGLMHEQIYGGFMNQNYGAVAWPIGARYTLALSVTRFGIDDIPDTRGALIDLNGNGVLDPNERLNYDAIQYFNTADWAAYLTYAFRMNENIALGVNLKLIRRDLADASATGVGFDIGARYAVTQRFTLGAAVQDVTTTLIAWNTGTNDLVSPTLKVGGAYRLEMAGGAITPTVDVDIRGENRQTAAFTHVGPVSIDPHLGLEYQFQQLFALRLGMNDKQMFTAGAGVHLPKLYLDYAYTPSPMALESDNLYSMGTHRISLRLALEEKKFSRPAN